MQGQRDSPLTAEGIRQACEMAARLRGHGIRTVCSSPLGRALRTAVIIAETLGADLVQVPELAEVDHGEMAGLTWAEIDARFPGAVPHVPRTGTDGRFPVVRATRRRDPAPKRR